MFRRMLISSIVLTVVVSAALGIVYPVVATGIGRLVFPNRTDGSLVKKDGKVVGSSLLGQEFLTPKGDPDPRYFQPRPSAAGTGYDPQASAATNLGPGDPRLVGFIPGFNTVGLDGSTSATNPFATSADPYCVPTDPTGAPVIAPTSGQKYAKTKDGEYVCDTSTVPERADAYRQLNGLSSTAMVPNDAVTASGSGLDPDISVSNADLQAPRVAKARHLALATVRHLVRAHTTGRELGFLGEKTVNVLELNLALNSAGTQG